MTEMQEIRQIIEDKLTGIHAEIKANNHFLNEQNKHICKELEGIKKRQDMTNGRIEKQENQTKGIRYIEAKPVLFITLLILLIVICNHVQIEDIINLIIKLS